MAVLSQFGTRGAPYGKAVGNRRRTATGSALSFRYSCRYQNVIPMRPVVWWPHKESHGAPDNRAAYRKCSDRRREYTNYHFRDCAHCEPPHLQPNPMKLSTWLVGQAETFLFFHLPCPAGIYILHSVVEQRLPADRAFFIWIHDPPGGDSAGIVLTPLDRESDGDFCVCHGAENCTLVHDIGDSGN